MKLLPLLNKIWKLQLPVLKKKQKLFKKLLSILKKPELRKSKLIYLLKATWNKVLIFFHSQQPQKVMES